MRLVVFTRSADALDATSLRLLHERGGVSAVLVCHEARRAPSRRSDRTHSAGGRAAPVDEIDLDWLWCRNSGGEALDSTIRTWGPDLALALDESPSRMVGSALFPRGVVTVAPRDTDSAFVVAALARGDDWLHASASWVGADGSPTCVMSARAPIYPDDTISDVRARVEELRRTVIVRAVRAAGEGRAAPQPAEPSAPAGRVSLRARLTVRLRERVRTARSVLRPRRLAKDTLTLAALGIFRPLRDATRTMRRRHPVRIFTFHRVTDLCRDKISVPPADFRRRIEYIRRHHDVVDLDTALRAIERRERLRRPLAAITFDDGYRNVFDHARPILAEQGLAACCFATTELVGTDRRFAHDDASPVRPLLEVMDWTELATLRALGWGIGAHTATHRRLSACPPDEYPREIAAPLAELRGRLALEEVSIAYPYGTRTDIDAGSLDAIARAGYRACLSNYGGENFPGDGLLHLKRFDVGGNHEPLAWRARVHGIDLGALRTWARGQVTRGGSAPR